VAGRTQPSDHEIDHLIKRRGGLIDKFSNELRMDEPQHGGQNAKCSTTSGTGFDVGASMRLSKALARLSDLTSVAHKLFDAALPSGIGRQRFVWQFAA
jgi:hypothetical protein